MKKDIILIITTIFLLSFVTVAYASFSSTLTISGEGIIETDSTPPTCGAWYLRESSLSIQDAYNQDAFINPGTNNTWTNTNKKLFVECYDNMVGDYGCIGVTQIIDSSNHRRYFKEVKEYTTSITTDPDTITVVLQDAYLNQTTCTLPVGGSNPYIDKEEPTITITKTSYNKFTYSATDNVGVQGYMVTTSSTTPTIDDEDWLSTPAEVTIDGFKPKTYHVWVKDGANISHQTIEPVLLTKDEGTGTTLTLKYGDSNGATLSTGYILPGTDVYATAQLQAGYNTLTLEKDNVAINDATVHTVNSATTFSTSALGNTYTIVFYKNGGTGSMPSQIMVYGGSSKLIKNDFTRGAYDFKEWNTNSSGTGVSYSDEATINLLDLTGSTLYLYAIWTPPTQFDTGRNVNAKMKKLAGNSSAYYYTSNTNITSIQKSSTEPTAANKTSDHIVSSSASKYPIYMWFDNGIIYWWSQDNDVYFNSDSSYMFDYFTSLTSIPSLPNISTKQVTNMSYMFDNCSSLTSLDLSNFNTSSVTNMSYMFDNCSSLTSLDVSNFNTSSVTNMTYMFCNCNSLTSLNLSGFNTSNVTNMSYMFQNCRALTSLNLSNFSTSGVTNMASMFSSCYALTSLNLSNFNTSNVTNMASMFSSCYTLTSLDLSNFDMAKVTNVNNMLNASGIVSLKTPNVYPGSSYTITLPRMMMDSNNNEYFRLNNLSPTSTWLESNLTEFDTGEKVNIKMKKLSGASSASYSTSNTTITSIQKSSAEPTSANKTSDHIVSSAASKYPIYMWFDNGTIYWWSQDSNVYFNTNSSYMFSNLKSLTSIPSLPNINTKQVDNMYYMFNYCQSLTSLDLSNFNTSNVTNMSYMFNRCSSLTNLNLSSFNTSNVTNMSYMFQSCSSLTSLLLSSFNTGKVTNMSYMFSGCSSLPSINVSSFNTSNVTNMESTFSGGNALTSLDLSNFDMSKVTSTSSMLSYLTALTSLKTPNTYPSNSSYTITLPKLMVAQNGTDHIVLNNTSPTSTWLYSVTEFDTGENVNAKMKMLAGNSSATSSSEDTTITSIQKSSTEPTSANKTSDHIVSSAASKYPIYMWYSSGVIYWWSQDSNVYLNSNSSSIFRNLRSLTSIPSLPNINTKQVTNMSYMFQNCRALTSVNLSNFNTSNVTNMSYMFQECRQLTSINVSTFDTGKVVSMAYMFNYVPKLQSLDLSNFNTSNVTNMTSMFKECGSLTSINVSSFNTSKVTNMTNMFYSDKALTSLDLSNFNMSKVTSTASMLTSLSALASLKTPNTYPSNSSYTIELPKIMMDSNNNEYTTLNKTSPTSTWLYSATEFDTGQNVAKKMKILAGNSSASYSTQNTTITSIQKSSTEPTAANKTSDHIVSSSASKYPIYMWYSNGVIYWWTQDSKVYFNSNSAYMFYNLRSLTSIPSLSNISTKQVTNMGYMFYYCQSITSLDLSSFDMSKVTSTSNMLKYMNGVTSLKTPNTYPSSTTTALPKTMYASNGTSYSTIGSTSPTSTWLYSTKP